ncbi:hypothetical protein C0992_011444 [Termitomyces sp. T32_za158]|nr:hypothetical protein C0992_011444 [Termitomyces sp. T32_za158]
MPRENSFSDSEGRSLTPDLDEIEDPTSSALPNVQAPTYSPPMNQPISVHPRSPSKRLSKIESRSPISQNNRPWPKNGNVHTPIERFRSVVRKVMALHRGASYLAGNVARVGAEPGVNPRRASANLLYGHIRQDCVIEVINYSTVRSSFDRMTNREFIDFLNDPVASERQPWMKVRWINIGGMSWDVLKAVSIKYGAYVILEASSTIDALKGLHPLSLEDIFHTPSQTRSKADYYNRHLFLRVLCHVLGQEDETAAARTDSMTYGTMLMDGPRSETPSAMSDPDRLDKEAVREEDDYTMYDNETTSGREKKRGRLLSLFHVAPNDLEGTLAHRSGSISSLAQLMSRAAAQRRKQANTNITLEALKQGDRVNVNVSPMFIFLLRDGTVISIHPVPNLKLTSPVSTRLHQRDTGLRNSADPSLLVHALLDLIVDNALEVIDEYHAKINRFERAILMKPNVQTVRYLHILSGDLIMHKRTLEPIKTLIYGLRRYDLDRCQALIDMSDPANANVKVVGFMSHKTKIYLLASYEMNQVM